ncbi:MAG TPA: hypothetical protein VHE83_03300, partial [Mycobacteriales bacterium]|nr:hypothetical protein [Mycobacteriales bacterium]
KAGRTMGTALLGLSIAGTAVGGFAGAGSIRTSKARHRAAVAAANTVAANLRARAGYASAVQGVAGDVLANVQPMEQVLHAMDDYKPGAVFAIQDALTRAGVGPQLQADVDRLQALHAPAGVTADAADLVRRAGDLHASFVSLAGAVGRTRDQALFDVLTGDKVDALREAEQEWHSSLVTLYGHLHATTPGSPSASGGWSGPGDVPTATKATWIARADEACGNAQYRTSRLPEDPKTPQAFGDAQEKLSHIVLDAAHQLKAIPLPQADAAHLQTTIIDHLGAVEAFGHDVATSAKDMRSESLSALDADFDKIDADIALTKPLERAFRSYGATLCSAYFTVDTGHHSGGDSTSSPSGINA